MTRSLRPDIRNPVLALPAAIRLRKFLLTLPPEVTVILADLVREIAADGRGRAQKSWKRNKGPMALYWKCVGVYAGHLYRAIRP